MLKSIKYLFALTLATICICAITTIAYAEKNYYGITNANSLNLREQPNLSASIIKTLEKDTKLTIIEKLSDWYLVITSNGDKGWASSNYIEIKSSNSFSKITGNYVNLRKSPNLNGQVVMQLFSDTDVCIKDFKNGWYYVVTGDNQAGWIYKDYVIHPAKGNEQNHLISRSMDRKSSANLIGFAKEHLNSPYQYGKSGPNAFDCSGLTFYVYKNFGITLPRTSFEQAKAGTYVSKEDLKMGDLVFFDTTSNYRKRISHVGIYIENGNFIHASSGSKTKKVIISNLNKGYYMNKYVLARRIL